MHDAVGRRNRLGLFTLALVLTQLGCATTQGLTRTDRLHTLAGRHIYDAPLEKVWPQASGLLRDEGYPLKESPDSFQLVTDWKEVVGGSLGKVWVQYMAWGERLGGDRCIVRILRSQVVLVPSELRSTTSNHNGSGMEQANPLKTSTPLGLRLRFKKAEDRAASGTTQTAGRDLGMEWELLKRAAPVIAGQMEASTAAR
jgi:hypothetical protein